MSQDSIVAAAFAEAKEKYDQILREQDSQLQKLHERKSQLLAAIADASSQLQQKLDQNKRVREEPESLESAKRAKIQHEAPIEDDPSCSGTCSLPPASDDGDSKEPQRLTVSAKLQKVEAELPTWSFHIQSYLFDEAAFSCKGELALSLLGKDDSHATITITKAVFPRVKISALSTSFSCLGSWNSAHNELRIVAAADDCQASARLTIHIPSDVLAQAVLSE